MAKLHYLHTLEQSLWGLMHSFASPLRVPIDQHKMVVLRGTMKPIGFPHMFDKPSSKKPNFAAKKWPLLACWSSTPWFAGSDLLYSVDLPKKYTVWSDLEEVNPFGTTGWLEILLAVNAMGRIKMKMQKSQPAFPLTAVKNNNRIRIPISS